MTNHEETAKRLANLVCGHEPDDSRLAWVCLDCVVAVLAERDEEISQLRADRDAAYVRGLTRASELVCCTECIHGKYPSCDACINDAIAAEIEKAK